MDKFDAVNLIRSKLEGEALEAFDWLLKVWNTDDDRLIEDFSEPYGVNYEPKEDEDEKLVNEIARLSGYNPTYKKGAP